MQSVYSAAPADCARETDRYFLSKILFWELNLGEASLYENNFYLSIIYSSMLFHAVVFKLFGVRPWKINYLVELILRKMNFIKNSMFALLGTDLGLFGKVNCMFLCQKYHQKLTIWTKQDKHTSLTKWHYSVQILDVIFFKYFDKFHFYLLMDGGGVQEISFLFISSM